MQGVLANLLLTSPALKAMVSDRVDWDDIPQGEDKPAIVMFVISGVIDYTMAGASGLVATRVQCDSRARTAADARVVACAIAAVLSGYRGVFSGFQFGGVFQRGHRTAIDKSGPGKTYVDSRDYQIWWAPTA